jgi:hypothetical protein
MAVTPLEDEASPSEWNNTILERRITYGERQEMAQEKNSQTQAQKEAEENPLAEKAEKVDEDNLDLCRYHRQGL